MRIKNKQITLWVTDEDKTAIKKHAADYGLGISAYLYRLGMAGENPFTAKELSIARKPVHLSGPAGPASLGVFGERRKRVLNGSANHSHPSKDRRERHG